MNFVPSYKSIWKVSYPIFLSLLAQNIIIVIDTAFLGRVGEIELGASAIGGLFYVSLFILGFGFGTGAQILVGRRNGEKNYKQIGNIVDHSIYFLIVLSIGLFFLTNFISSTVLKTIISSPDIYFFSQQYLDVRIWGLVFAFSNTAFRAFYIGITNTKYLIHSAVIMAIVNIGLDYLLIFGNYNFPQMGIRGAALASVIAEGVSVIYFILITIIKVDLKKYNLFRFPKLNVQVIKNILNVAVFIMMQHFFSIGGWFVFFMIIEQTGERPLAASNIIRTMYMILTIPIWGLGSATNTIVSNIIGQNRIDLVLPVIKRITKLSFFSILGVIIVTFIFARDIISFYTNDQSLIEDTLGPLYVILGVLVIFSLTIIVFNGVAGTANTQISLGIEIISIVVYIFTAYVLAIKFNSSTEVIWCSEYVYFIILGLLSYWYILKGKWMKKVI